MNMICEFFQVSFWYKHDAQHSQENKWKPFFGGHTKKTVGKSFTTTFWKNLGKNPLHTQKFPCSYTYAPRPPP